MVNNFKIVRCIMIYIRLYTHVADCCVQLFSFSRALFRLLFFPILFAFLHSIKKNVHASIQKTQQKMLTYKKVNSSLIYQEQHV